MNPIKSILNFFGSKPYDGPKIYPFSPLEEDSKKENIEVNEIELNDIDLNNIDPDDLLNNNLEVFLKQIPIDWFVFEMGQSPIDRTWFCQLVEINSVLTDDVSDDLSNVKHVTAIDKKTLCQALFECLSKIEESDYDND